MTGTHDLRARSPPLYRLSYKVGREQAVGTEDVKVTAMNMYKYKEKSSFPTLVRVFLCPCVGPFPSVALTLTWFIWDRNRALHITLYSVNVILAL